MLSLYYLELELFLDLVSNIVRMSRQSLWLMQLAELKDVLSFIAVVLNLSNFQEIWNSLDIWHSVAVNPLLQSSFRHLVERFVMMHFDFVLS